MRQDHNHRERASRPDVDMVTDFADSDSIVDRLLSLPATSNGANAWQNGTARRMEKVLAERMRNWIEGAH